MTDQELKEAIALCKQCPTPLTPQWQLILDTCQSVLDAQGALLGKKDNDFPDQSCCEEVWLEQVKNKSYNQAISDCALRLAKRLEGLEDVIDEMVGDIYKSRYYATAIRKHILGGE